MAKNYIVSFLWQSKPFLFSLLYLFLRKRVPIFHRKLHFNVLIYIWVLCTSGKFRKTSLQGASTSNIILYMFCKVYLISLIIDSSLCALQNCDQSLRPKSGQLRSEILCFSSKWKIMWARAHRRKLTRAGSGSRAQGPFFGGLTGSQALIGWAHGLKVPPLWGPHYKKPILDKNR